MARMRTRRLLLALPFVGCALAPGESFEPPRDDAPPLAPTPPAVSAPLPTAAETPDAALPLGACAGPPGRTLRTLLVGNSQIYFWNLPRILSELSGAAPLACPRIAAEGFTRGGQTLRNLWRDGDSLGRDLATTIREGAYDVIVIAESIGLVELDFPHHDFVEHATLLIDAARASGAMPVLYATPYPDKEGHLFFVEMAEPQLALGRQRAVPVAAGSLAWLRVWRELPDIDLHHPDREHPGYPGSIVSAMVLYAVITRATPLAVTVEPKPTCEDRPGREVPCPPISPAELAVFRRAAWAEALETGIDAP